jgi:hypothetical protein
MHREFRIVVIAPEKIIDPPFFTAQDAHGRAPPLQILEVF